MLKEKSFTQPNIQIAGENALIIYFNSESNNDASVKVQQAVQSLRHAMKHNVATDIIDLIPSYASILVVFNIYESNHHQIRNKLRQLLQSNVEKPVFDKDTPSLVELPVYYSAESGPDLVTIAEQNKLSIEQVIEIHHSQEYHVYAIGFAPGFAYLGEVNKKIATPRLNTPRMKVPKGAVAIADQQTAIYPKESPGGWNIVGLCPIDMFDVSSSPSMPIKVGDKVKFKRVCKDEFLALGGKLSRFGTPL